MSWIVASRSAYFTIHEVLWLATSDLTIDLTLWVMVSKEEDSEKHWNKYKQKKSDAATQLEEEEGKEEQFNFFLSFSCNDWCALNWVK